MEEIFDVKVTRINDRWHIRLLLLEDGRVIDEMACADQENIGFCCHTVLRWADKLGWVSPMAKAARKRFIGGPRNRGKVWYNKDLPLMN